MNTKERLQFYADITEKELNRLVPETECLQKVMYEAMRYSLLAGGKRLRPALMMEFCRVCGGSIEDALPFACALEMIHTYSLIHDDLPCMDNDDLRRGRPTSHKVYGEAFAVLAGDALLNRAFETMLDPALIRIPADRALRASFELASCAGVNGMIGGQTVDVGNDGKMAGLDELEAMISMKTGALIRAAAKAGCIIAGADEKQTAAAVTYADCVGLAFQIADDILDIEGDEQKLGKPIGSDKEQGKTTFPEILGISVCKERIASLTQEAKSAVSCFADSVFLSELADLLANRDH